MESIEDTADRIVWTIIKEMRRAKVFANLSLGQEAIFHVRLIEKDLLNDRRCREGTAVLYANTAQGERGGEDAD